ncbi:hypothetical protein ABL78_2254 [Leptomonas seymouri]|uniref:C2 domain-containing protein n=1 Tax=Leptomonas seymouri TaxID=5684 RepID=A0A0N1I6C6_LEPSE|nr:hypothetical protein ABL78_2254 [Leptomonas seymouri]|eukprot:KPI88650.1 hypothetical protein ABL78_2254 [Leptomonas seymouri]
MATLKVTVHEARDLPIMDRATGLADPYVVVKLDDMEHTTDVARRTRNPVWEHDVRFDTADLLVLQEDPLEIRVYDHDIISRDDIVGMILLDCNSIIYRDNPAVSGWFPLIDSDAGLHGDIRLTIRIKFHAAENPLAPALPERYVRCLDPRVAEHLPHPSSVASPSPASANTNKNRNGNEAAGNPSATSAAAVNSGMGNLHPASQKQQQHLQLPPTPADEGTSQSSAQRAAYSPSSGAAASATVPYPRAHAASASLPQSQQPSQTMRSPFFHPDMHLAAFTSGSSPSMAMNVADSASPAQLTSPALLPLLAEQNLDPLQVARVNHPTLAAEEEGIFVFSVWRLDPAVFRVESTHSMMEELIVKSDPEHVRFTNLRSSRSINDARVIQLFKLSGKVRRQLARKVVELQCNAVLGYVEEFDMEPNGIIVRAYGTPCVVSKVKYVDESEMQRFLRSKKRYLQSSIAAAYETELAQQMQHSPRALAHGASTLPAIGASSMNTRDHPGAGGGPTHLPPPATAHPRTLIEESSPLTLVSTAAAVAAQDLLEISSSTLQSQKLMSPPMNCVTATTDNMTRSAAAHDHMLPPSMVSLTNSSTSAAQMPPDTTSTAVQSPTTTPVYRPTDPARAAQGDDAGGAETYPVTSPRILDDGSNGRPAVTSASAASHLNNARAGPPESAAAAVAGTGANGAPSAVPPALQVSHTTAAATRSALTASARVIISILTVKDLPAGSIHHIGGYICARSVKIVSRVKSRQVISQERDAWWMELREELRANARAFHCNTVLGYEEETQYHEDVVLLSLYGTAVMLDMSVTSLRGGPQYLFQLQKQRVAAKRNCALLHLYEGPRRKDGSPGMGLLASEVGDLLLHHECSICHNKPVPEVLLAACTLPAELSCEAPPRLVQVAVSKTKPNVKGVELAMAVSQALPFIEFALHKQMLFNLRLQQMNACFALRVSIVVGPDAIIGTLIGSGCRLAGLPVPRVPRISVVDPLIANKESVVKLRDVIASRHRRHYNGNRNSSSRSSSSSSSSSSTSSSGSSSQLSLPAGGKPGTTPQLTLPKGSERSGSAIRTSFPDDVSAVAAAQQQHQQKDNTSAPVSASTSVSTSKRRNQRRLERQRQQHLKSSRRQRNRRSSRRRTHRHKHGSTDSSASARSSSSGSKSGGGSRTASSNVASLRSGARGQRVKKHRRKHRTRNGNHNVNRNSMHAAGEEAASGPQRSFAGPATNLASPTSSSSSSSSSSSTSVSSSSRSARSDSSSTSHSSRSSASPNSSSNSWVPTESSESDEDVYAPADEWHAWSSGVRTKTSDYVVKIDDVEEADMMLGMVDSTNFEDGVLLTLPYVPDSANAFDWQERIVLDRRYSRAPVPLCLASSSSGGGGGGGGGVNNSSLSRAARGYGGLYSGTLRDGGSSNIFSNGNTRSDGGGQGEAAGGGADGSVVLNHAAAAGHTALTTRLLNEYCADAKRAFVHRACRMAMRTCQPLRLRVVSLRTEMTFVPNSADLQLRLEGCVMVASSAGSRQLRALEDRAFRVCMHYSLESLSSLWQCHQQQQLQGHSSHSKAGGGGTPTPALRPACTSLATAVNVNTSSRGAPSFPLNPSSPVLSPMMGGDVVSYNASSRRNNTSLYSSRQQQQPPAGLGPSAPNSASLLNLTTASASAGSKLSMSAPLPLVGSEPAYLDARRLFVTCNAPFSMPYVQDITVPPPRVWSGVATAFSEDTATSPKSTSTYAEYRDSRGSRTASLARHWHAFARATRQSIRGLVDRATGGTGDRIDRRLQQQRKWFSSRADGSALHLPDGVEAVNNSSLSLSMAGQRDANYSHPAARLPQDISQLRQLIPVVLFTPLDYVAGRSIVRYLGRLSQHFIREDYDTGTGDDLNVFFQRAEVEIMCMVQALVRLMGGNALLKHRIVYHEICDSDGSGSAFLFATVTGDVVQVSDTEYWGPSQREGHAKKHHSYSKSRSKRDGEDGASADGGNSTPRNRPRNEDAAEDSDKDHGPSAAGKQRKSRRGTLRHQSSRRRHSRGHRHRHRHRRSSSSSAFSAASRGTVSSTTTANSGAPVPHRGQQCGGAP